MDAFFANRVYFCLRKTGIKLPGGPVSEPSSWILKTVVPAGTVERDLLSAAGVSAVGNVAFKGKVRLAAGLQFQKHTTSLVGVGSLDPGGANDQRQGKLRRFD